MPGAKKNFIGLEGFVWWVGIVEDRQDPEQLGRVRVRCFGWHTDDKTKIATDALPWAHPMIPVNNPTAYTPKEGDVVMGFFLDGESAQDPVIMGVLPGKPVKKPDYSKGFSDPRKSLSSVPKKPDDSAEAYPKTKYLREATTSRLARGKIDSTIVATRKKNMKSGITSAGGVSWAEPAPAYAAKYPYNNVLETESGHAFELDDSPGAERVQLAHRGGSYIEIDKDGNRAERVQKDNYEVIMGSDYVYIGGKCSITVGGDCNLKVTGKINIEAAEINMAASGAVKIKGGSVKIESDGETDIKSGGTAKFSSGGKLNLSGATAALGGATVDIPAGKVNLQSGSVSPASGTGLSVSGGSSGGSTSSSGNATGEMGKALDTATNGAAKVVGAVASVANTAASVVGKAVSGITSAVSGVYDTVMSVSDGLLKDFDAQLPIGELTNNVKVYGDVINDNKGNILALKDDLKSQVFNKIDEVSTRAANLNIPVNINGDIQTAIYAAKNNNVSNSVEYVVGKHIYPKTETIAVANT